MDDFDVALSMFEDFYEFCLNNGIEPEQVVKEMGGMELITDLED